MFLTYDSPVYEYQQSPDQRTSTPAHHPLVIIGAGPVGCAAALDAGYHGLSALVLDDNNTVSVGSRAVCYSKRALEILNRFDCAQRMVDKGVTWKVGKIFFQDELIRQFDLLPSPGHQQPAFINLQQYYLEEYMLDRLRDFEHVEVRWKNRVVGVQESADKVTLTIDTPDGDYQISCDWLVVADGANSDVRRMMGLESTGQVFQDRFLIADIVMKADFPPERWFSFDPSYHRGWSTLLHRQPDDVWRLDFQLGWEADPEEEKKPENIIPRVKAMIGKDVAFELEWASVYTFTCRRMENFRHGRLLYVGDAAHQVSPFGARGANSGIQDTDNLMWKLGLVMQGAAPERLLDSYDQERGWAADENIMNSTRATDFITPKSDASKVFRNAVLELARDCEFAQSLTNSGRLSDTAFLLNSVLNTPDSDHFDGEMIPGAVLDDAPVSGDAGERWLLKALGGRFQLLYFAAPDAALSAETLAALKALNTSDIPVEAVVICGQGGHQALDGVRVMVDVEGYAQQRLDAQDGTCYLLRPDQHVAARWRVFDDVAVKQAVLTATGHS